MSLDSRPRPETTPAPAGDRAPVTYVVRREDDFPFDSVEYADLHRRAGSPPFQHGAWRSELYDVLAPRRRARKVVVTVRDAHDGRLVLVLPLVGLRRGMLRVLECANLRVTDYAVPVVDPRAAADLRGAPALVPPDTPTAHTRSTSLRRSSSGAAPSTRRSPGTSNASSSACGPGGNTGSGSSTTPPSSSPS